MEFVKFIAPETSAIKDWNHSNQLNVIRKMKKQLIRRVKERKKKYHNKSME